MRLIFLGPPGAGKGTQAHILEQRYDVHQISTGDILRSNLANGTELGKAAEQYMHGGELVPDDIMIAMIEDEIERHREGFILDGFPRTVGQAKALDDELERKGLSLDAVVLFKIDREALLTRLTSRWTNPRTGKTYNTITNPPRVAGVCDEDGGQLVQRPDDKLETAQRRIAVYEEQTQPLIAYYRRTGILLEVDALAPLDEVTRQIVGKLHRERAAS